MVNAIDNLIKKVHHLPSNDVLSIKKAIDFAKEQHAGQLRKTGDPYFIHPVEVAGVVADLEIGHEAIIAAILHDTVEDTETSVATIKKLFGPVVANLVDGVTKLGNVRISKAWFQTKKIESPDNDEQHRYQTQIETLRKMFVAMSRDLRVVIIKIADRYCNLKTLNFLPRDRQIRIARETMDIYSPIAYRLGMGEFQGLLEDMAFKFLEPKEYDWLQKLAVPAIEQREKYLRHVGKRLSATLNKAGIAASLTYRAKHWYSLYKKLLKHDRDINKIYDIVAMRIVVPTVEDCYNVLGIVHSLWTPLPGRIKDYIALPKPNGYQSIHTSVFADNGIITEIQIRTPEMHRQAEFGIAAHWYYGERKQSQLMNKEQLAWVKELARWQARIKNAKDLEQALALDFFSNRIFAFTPIGDVIDLPHGATAIDFAYAVHTAVGNQCYGAKINGKMSPIASVLENGDLVEIIKNKKVKPSRDWLKITKTEHARSWIRKMTADK